MTTIIIPKGINKIKEDLVAVPRDIFEDFLIWQKKTKITSPKIKHCKSFNISKKHEKFYNELDKELSEALKEYEKGKAIGTFNSVKEMMNSLES